jgi:hypothetical protein
LEPGRCLQAGIFFVSLRLVWPKFQMESQSVPSDGSGRSRTIAVVQMHVRLSFVCFCICVLNSLNRVVESLFENFRSITDWPPRQQSNGQWRAPSAAPQAAMLLTLSAHCLLPKRPRPEIDAIGHRSPFCEQFLTEWALTTQAISRKDPVAHAAAYLPSCFCKDK